MKSRLRVICWCFLTSFCQEIMSVLYVSHETHMWLNTLCVNGRQTSGSTFYFFNFILFLNLKHCISFAKHQNESTTGIHVLTILNPPPSPHHLSGLSQCTSPKHPVSCLEPGLATHFIYDITHVSIPFSQIFPPFPSPTESIRLFAGSTFKGFEFYQLPLLKLLR